MTRRKALSILAGLLAAGWSAAVAALAGAFVSTPLRRRTPAQRLSLGKRALLSKKYRLFRIESTVSDGWYARSGQTTVYARVDVDDNVHVISATCTHLGCTVRWNHEESEFQCPCHGGRFSSEGAVLGGPPPQPLNPIYSEVEDGEVFIRPQV